MWTLCALCFKGAGEGKEVEEQEKEAGSEGGTYKPSCFGVVGRNMHGHTEILGVLMCPPLVFWSFISA